MDAGATRLFRETEGRDAVGEIYEQIIDQTGDGVYHLDDDGRIRAINENALELLGHDREAVLGTSASDYVDEDDYEALNEAIGAVLEEDVDEPVTREVTMYHADGETFPCELRLGVVHQGEEFAGTIGVARDVTERKRRERALERQRDQLARLDRINRLVRGVARALVRASTRCDVESSVCDHLTRSDTYRYAWIGVPDRTDGSIDVREDGAVPEDLLAADRGDGGNPPDGEACLVARAGRTGEVQSGCPEECSLTEDDDAADRDVAAMACVPLQYEGRDYGVLSVYAGDERAFDVRELAVLEELGATVANALHATELRQALLSETVVELTVESRCKEQFFIALSALTESTVEWEGAVAADDGTVRYYVTVQDDDPALVRDLADDIDRVQAVTLVSEFDDAYLLEVTLDGDELLSTMGPASARLTDVVATDGEARATIELPRSSNVRDVVDRLADVLGDVEVTAQREVSRPRQTRRQFCAAIADELTERQRTVLATAYYNGLFEWPRASTGEEVAERLDIAPATFHYHLRAAEETVVAAALGDADEEGGDETTRIV